MENVRELIDELKPSSVLPDKPSPAQDPLAAVFSARSRVYYVGDKIPPWWSPERDKWLWRTMLNSDILASAIFSTSARLASIPVSVRPRDVNNRNHRRISAYASMLLEYYWQEIAFQAAMEWQTCDNGVFLEVLGAGEADGPIEPTRIPGTNDYLYALGLRILDSHNATRTGDPIYPVVYRHKPPSGPEKLYKLHRTRVIFMSQMPQPRRDMHGVGFCGASRVIHKIMRLEDIDLLEEEVLGRRPLAQLIFSKGVSAAYMQETFDLFDAKQIEAEAVNDTRRSSRTVFISAEGPPEAVKAAEIQTFDLKRWPEKYDPEVYMNLAVNVIAMGLGFDPREFWPATVRGATRADAEVQHWKSQRKTPGLWVNGFAQLLNRFFCPNVSEVSFDEQDDEQDRLRAEIRKVRADVLKTYRDADVLDQRTLWQIMLQEGDIGEEQYRELLKSEEFMLKAEERRLRMEMLRNQVERADGKIGEGPERAQSGESD